YPATVQDGDGDAVAAARFLIPRFGQIQLPVVPLLQRVELIVGFRRLAGQNPVRKGVLDARRGPKFFDERAGGPPVRGRGRVQGEPGRARQIRLQGERLAGEAEVTVRTERQRTQRLPGQLQVLRGLVEHDEHLTRHDRSRFRRGGGRQTVFSDAGAGTGHYSFNVTAVRIGLSNCDGDGRGRTGIAVMTPRFGTQFDGAGFLRRPLKRPGAVLQPDGIQRLSVRRDADVPDPYLIGGGAGYFHRVTECE